jgi:hypothetical protein
MDSNNNNNNKKTFFTDEIINSYVDYELNGGNPIRESLGGYELLNYEQFMKWWNDYPSSNLSKSKIIKDSINASFTRIFTNRCLNLSTGYIDRTIESIMTNPNFDVLFAVYNKSNIRLNNEKPPTIDEIDEYQSLKSDRVGGFIVVELGECKKQSQQPQRSIFNSFNFFSTNIKNENKINYNNVYSVFLICSNISNISDVNLPPIKGQLLMGAYLFTIKSNMLLPQIAILELLDGYRNIPGFIAYSKLGFEKDLSLYDKNCFYSLNTLPMSNNLTNKNTTDIIQFVTKDVDIIISPESRKILTFYESNKNNKENQEKLGLLYNILYKIELQPDKILTDLIKVYDDDNGDDHDNSDDDDTGDDDSGYTRNYEKMQDFFGYEETDDLTRVFNDKNNTFLNDDDYDKDRNIKISNYPKIIERIKQYYKEQIHDMLMPNKKRYNDNNNDDNDTVGNKRRKRGGKKQKTNKKHRQYKKKTNRNSKRKPKYKSKNRKIKTTKKLHIYS